MSQEKLMNAHCATCGNALGADQNCPSCLIQLGMSRRGPQRVISWLPPIHDLSPLFPQLEIKRLIGCGGMGAVYQARQTHLDRDVALKLIHQETSSDPNFLERFEREAKTLAKLAHPNIVTIFDYGQASNGIAYLIMEYVEGINLRQAIESKSLSADEAIAILRDLCSAVELAHSRGVVHRDIKPENILLSEEGAVKIADFGIAKIINDSVQYPNLTATRQVLGSPNYLAPEHMEAPELVDHRVDIYALGIVFYELLTGQLPWGQFESPRNLGVPINEAIDDIVMKALQRKPSMRFASAAQMREAIVQASNATSQQSSPLPFEPTKSKRSLAVPFSHESESGLVHAIGMVYSRQGSLQIEFRYRDPLFGIVKSDTHQVNIPKEQLNRLHLVHGTFSSRLEIVADSIAALGNLPEAEVGCVQLRIAKKDRELAEQVVESLGFVVQEKARRLNQPDAKSEGHMILGVLLLFCGIFNAGALAIGEIFVVRSFSQPSDKSDLAALSALLGIVWGPIAAFQIIAGFIHCIKPVKSFTKAALVVSMLPFTPIWGFSCPFAIWAFYFLKTREVPTVPESPRPGWGATTLTLLRESRTARWVSLANALLILIGSCGLIAYQFGYYPVTIQYRIVGHTSEKSATFNDGFRELLIARLRSAAISPDPYQPDRFNIHTYANQRKALIAQLSIQQPVRIVLIPLRSTDDSSSVNSRGDADPGKAWRWLPVTRSLPIDRANHRNTALGEEIAVLTDSIEITSSQYTSLSQVRSSQATDSRQSLNPEGQNLLRLRMSQAGRQVLNTLPGANREPYLLGLEIQGELVGISQASSRSEIDNDSSGVSNYDLQFLCALPPTKSGMSLDSIEAAIRGPSLPFELELLP